jgi:branched-chain amino acid transport system ATP-binding protein
VTADPAVTADSDMPVVSLSGGQASFGGVRALDGVDLAVPRGCLQGLVGPNGSGKSTLLAGLSRLLDLNAGRIEFMGTDCTRMPPSMIARLGMVRTYQTVRLQPHLTVLENVMLGADTRSSKNAFMRTWLWPPWMRATERKSRAAAESAIELLQLGHLANRYPTTLTYGTQRRVEIARALAGEPQLLLLDEPTAGMTRGERDEIAELLIRLRHQGLTQILVEHDVQMITDVCDRLVVLNFGRVIAEGTPAECVRQPAVQDAYVGRRHGVAP